MNPTRIQEDAGSTPGLAQRVIGSGVAASWGVDHRHSLDLVLLWLQCGMVAEARSQSLAWERPYATYAALKAKDKKQNKTKQKTGKRWRKDRFVSNRRKKR